MEGPEVVVAIKRLRRVMMMMLMMTMMIMTTMICLLSINRCLDCFFQSEICSTSLVDILQAVVGGADGCLFCYGHARIGTHPTVPPPHAYAQAPRCLLALPPDVY